MAQWLTIVSWVAVILGLATALAIAFDVAAHPQHMKIMNVVWPITGLYLPIVGWLLYGDMARRKPTRDMHAAQGGRPFWKSVFVSTTHCAAGCVIGDIIGAPIVFWAGWTLFGSRLLRRVFGSVCSRLYFWYRVPIPSDPRHAEDFAARRAH